MDTGPRPVNGKLTVRDDFGFSFTCSRDAFLDMQELERKERKRMKMCKKIKHRPGYGKLMSIHYEGGQ